MTVHIHRASLTYFALPKVACTSLKHFFHEVRTGQPFVPPRPGRHIHHTHPTKLLANLPGNFIEADERILVIRDPIRRLVSAYRNRVHGHRELSKAKSGLALEAHGLAPYPTLTQFVDQLEQYQEAVPSIRHHTRPMVDFVGHDMTYFTRVYDISGVEALAAFVNRKMGTAVQLQRRQTKGGSQTIDDLGPAQREKLLAYYSEDYRALRTVRAE